MKNIIFTILALALVAGALLAADQTPKPEATAKVLTYEGTIIDNLCATGNKVNLGKFIKTHTKECALMPNCAASGYSLYMPDGSLMAFDKASGVKIQKFLKKKSSKLEVSVSANSNDGTLQLVSIKNITAKEGTGK
jgi:type 1 fimbria pilin